MLGFFASKPLGALPVRRAPASRRQGMEGWCSPLTTPIAGCCARQTWHGSDKCTNSEAVQRNEVKPKDVRFELSKLPAEAQCWMRPY